MSHNNLLLGPIVFLVTCGGIAAIFMCAFKATDTCDTKKRVRYIAGAIAVPFAGIILIAALYTLADIMLSPILK